MMVNIDELALKINESDDDRRQTIMARLSVITEDDEGRVTETIHTIDFYRDNDYQFNTAARPLSRY